MSYDHECYEMYFEFISSLIVTMYIYTPVISTGQPKVAQI
jgi:hypothetical protein